MDTHEPGWIVLDEPDTGTMPPGVITGPAATIGVAVKLWVTGAAAA